VNFSWMAWTMPTALFFGAIALILTGMGVMAVIAPRNDARIGVIGIATQRGDRLFLSLLGSAFIHLAWIALAPGGLPLWGASLASLVYAALVFRFV
jgi:predicted small integral membrane protein